MINTIFYQLLIISITISSIICGNGMLYPRDSESRETKLLDGIWEFKTDSSPTRNKSFIEEWWMKKLSEHGPVIDMPVPSSYNDVTQDKKLRDFVGWVWYEKTFYISCGWSKERVVLRFDSAHYFAKVWLNGEYLMEHDGGHLPFEKEVTSLLVVCGSNRLTVAVNNTLSPTTLPPGSIQYENDTSRYPPGYFVQNLQMDFFNYAGIHRHVWLYTTPAVYIDDITILTDVSPNQDMATVHYDIILAGAGNSSLYNVSVSVLDGQGHTIAAGKHLSGGFTVNNPQLWWPFGMNKSVGYRYILEVKVNKDVYRQPFGIRTVKVTENQFLINSKPFYCHGVAKHEDSDLRGKGLDHTLIVKDMNLMRWMGVNCVRTSHYPYAEEFLDMCDRQGVAIINESPGVGIQNVDNFGEKSLSHHLEVMTEMIRRDKNKPSVIMWSVANEPRTNLEVSVPYFKAVIQHTKEIDPAHRPVTFVCNQRFEAEKVVPYVDVMCLNRYYGWYHDPGHLEVIQPQLHRELQGFRNLYKKPIIITEYGADTVPGLHRDPSMMFTEEYQEDFLSEYHSVFDLTRQQFLVGEMVWNFADFMTVQGVTRVVGNKKGLLTRQRQPKAAAHLIRQRYLALAAGTEPSETCTSYARQKYSHTPHAYIHR